MVIRSAMLGLTWLTSAALAESIRDEVAGAAAETRPWMCRGADMPQALEAGVVPGGGRERTPCCVLIDPAITGVRVTADEVDIHRV